MPESSKKSSKRWICEAGADEGTRKQTKEQTKTQTTEADAEAPAMPLLEGPGA